MKATKELQDTIDNLKEILVKHPHIPKAQIFAAVGAKLIASIHEQSEGDSIKAISILTQALIESVYELAKRELEDRTEREISFGE